MRRAYGVAVKSRELIVVEPDQEEFLTLPYNQRGLEKILEKKPEKIIISGNYRWAKPLAYALNKRGIEVRYLPSPQLSRGERQSQEKMLLVALKREFSGRPFFKKFGEESPHPWLTLANKYFLHEDEIRRKKHHILTNLRLIWPELFHFLENKIWERKFREPLMEGRWYDIELLTHSQIFYNSSLARYLPSQEQVKAFEELRRDLRELSELEAERERILEEVDQEVAHFPVVKLYNNSQSIKLLVLLIGWRKWGNTKIGFRKLRAYSGLSPTRIDSKGKFRISRVRPRIRQTLFLLQSTGRAKEVLQEVKIRKNKIKRVERLEYLLKDVWRNLELS